LVSNHLFDRWDRDVEGVPPRPWNMRWPHPNLS
jgi:hypothetical protein